MFSPKAWRISSSEGSGGRTHQNFDIWSSANHDGPPRHGDVLLQRISGTKENPGPFLVERSEHSRNQRSLMHEDDSFKKENGRSSSALNLLSYRITEDILSVSERD